MDATIGIDGAPSLRLIIFCTLCLLLVSLLQLISTLADPSRQYSHLRRLDWSDLSPPTQLDLEFRRSNVSLLDL